jgi:hypothetical protein
MVNYFITLLVQEKTGSRREEHEMILRVMAFIAKLI